MRVPRQYKNLFNLTLVSLALGLILTIVRGTQDTAFELLGFPAMIVLSLLALSLLGVTLTSFTKKRRYHRAMKKTAPVFMNAVPVTMPKIFNLFIRQPEITPQHPIKDDFDMREFVYVVTTPDGPYVVERMGFADWLKKVWRLQRFYEVNKQNQKSPLARDYWRPKIGMETYTAYMCILIECDVLDPESTYHVKKLRFGATAWNVVLVADERIKLERR